ncbi:MAG: S16 family serine protease, partial [Myxococcales bacterium]
ARAGLAVVVVPEANARELLDLPLAVRRAVTLVPARSVEDVLAVALAAGPLEVQAGVQARLEGAPGKC